MWVIYVPRTDTMLQNLAEAWAPIRQTKGDAKKATLGDDATAKAAIDKKHRIVVVMYPKAIQNAATLDKDDVVYIMGGHCMGSSANLTWPDNAQNPIPFNEVGDRLVNAGLRHDFQGAIKVYSCQSGIGGNDAFGKRFANYMRDIKNFTCPIWAYSGNISTDYINTKPSATEPAAIRMKARNIVPELREEGGVHKFMQIQARDPYRKRGKDSKDKM